MSSSAAAWPTNVFLIVFRQQWRSVAQKKGVNQILDSQTLIILIIYNWYVYVTNSTGKLLVDRQLHIKHREFRVTLGTGSRSTSRGVYRWLLYQLSHCCLVCLQFLDAVPCRFYGICWQWQKDQLQHSITKIFLIKINIGLRWMTSCNTCESVSCFILLPPSWTAAVWSATLSALIKVVFHVTAF